MNVAKTRVPAIATRIIRWFVCVILTSGAAAATLFILSGDRSWFDIAIGWSFMMIPVVPAGIIGLALSRLPIFRRRQLGISLILPACVAFYPVVQLLLDRHNPERTFEIRIRQKLPAHAIRFRSAINSIPPFYDLEDWYAFEAPRDEVEGLLTALHRASPDELKILAPAILVRSPVPGESDFWEGLESWPHHGAGFPSIVTDASRTRVFVFHPAI